MVIRQFAEKVQILLSEEYVVSQIELTLKKK